MSLKPLSKVAATNLVSISSQDWKDDMIAKIQLDPEWNAIYDGDLFQNAFQMIMELGVYLAQKNAQSSNQQIKEKFLNQAFSPQSINDNLMDMRIDLQQCTGSSAILNATIINEILTDSIVIPKFQPVYGTNPNGERVTFELLMTDVDGKFNYFDNIIVTPTVEFTNYFRVTAYAGETFTYEYQITPEMKENFAIAISNTNIIEGSIRIFYITAGGARVECIETESFVVEPVVVLPYFPDGVPHYTIKHNFDGSAKILFGNASFGGAFEDIHVGQYIKVYGRNNGGARTNVNAGMINYPIQVLIAGGTYLTVQLTNPTAATGGADQEDIYLAQLFAPYRFGRDKTIIDSQDAQAALHNYVEKHEISSPQYSDDPAFENVPILHSFHRIAPIRDFSTMVYPDILPTDTATTYNVKFLEALNNFLNVQGSHSVPVDEEAVTNFVYPDVNGLTFYSYTPAYQFPLSASLIANAYDVNGRLIDSVVFGSNYITDQKTKGYSSSTPPSEHAIILTNEFSTVTILNNTIGRNDYLVFSFDYDVFHFIFNITMTTGIKTYEKYAEELQAAIVAAIDASPTASAAFGTYRNWQFITTQISTTNSAMGRVVFTSPSYGINSRITIMDNGTADTVTDPDYNIYLFLGLQKKNYRPATQTGLVFDTSTFKYNNNILTLNMKPSVYSVSKTITEPNLGIIINHAVADGPVVTVPLVDDDNLLQELFENYEMDVIAYDSTNTEIDRLPFTNILSTSDTTATPNTGVVFNASGNKYVYNTSIVTIKLLNNVVVPAYKSGYPTIYSVNLTRLILISPGVYQKDPNFDPIIILENNGNYTFDITSQPGSVLTLALTTDQNNSFSIGDNMVVEFIHRDSQGILSVVENAKILNIQDSETLNVFQTPEITTATVDMTYTVTGNPGNRYERNNKLLRFKFLDGTADPSVTYYAAGYAPFDHVIITYKRKSYNDITIDYEPNPYFPEAEAAVLINLLNNTSKRLIGLENIIKPIRFVPRPITVSLVIKRGYGVAEAQNAVRSQLSLDFEYANDNFEHTIGSLMTLQLIKNSINKVASQYGIIDITILNAEDTDDITASSTAYTYKFISDDIYEKLRLLENSRSQISGISSLYKVTVNAISQELRA